MTKSFLELSDIHYLQFLSKIMWINYDFACHAWWLDGHEILICSTLLYKLETKFHFEEITGEWMWSCFHLFFGWSIQVSHFLCLVKKRDIQERLLFRSQIIYMGLSRFAELMPCLHDKVLASATAAALNHSIDLKKTQVELPLFYCTIMFFSISSYKLSPWLCCSRWPLLG